MKIAMITNFSPVTGAGKYAFQLFNNLNLRGADLIYCKSGNDRLDWPNSEKIKRINGLNFPFYRETLNWYFYYPKKIPAGYDIYHATNQFLSGVCRFRKPSVLTVLDLVLIKSKKYAPALTNYLQKRALENIGSAQKIISISEDTKRDIVNILGVDEDKVKVIYLGVDHNIFKSRKMSECRKKLNLPLNKKIILHVGSDDPRRNIETVLQSFSELLKLHNDCVLVKVGRFSEKSLALINKLGLSGKVLNFQRIAEENLPLYYSSADVFLCLDIETGFGMPSLEAMACGTSVVCSKGGAFPEIVHNAGLLVEPTNVIEIVSAVDKILSSPAMRAKLAARAISIADTFSWQKCADETYSVYEEVL